MASNTLEKLINQDHESISTRIEGFISSYISKNSAKGLVVGLSGGLDSSVVLKLAVNALSHSKVSGLLMPSDTTPKEDIKHATELASSLGVEYKIVDINLILQKYAEVLPEDKMARGNLMARVRMNILYYFARINSYLVAGTSDKSEIKIGYFTKFGDGAADILPIADLYKTQVRALAKYLGIPKLIVEKKSSPRLWSDQLAEQEIGMGYEAIDQILHLLIDKKLKPPTIVRKLGVSPKDVYRIKNMMDASRHKRCMPAIALLKN